MRLGFRVFGKNIETHFYLFEASNKLGLINKIVRDVVLIQIDIEPS